MLWNKVTITYGPRDYEERYKRPQAKHNHELAQQFTRDAMQISLGEINAHLLANQAPVTQNQLGIQNQASDLQKDPGPQWRQI
jgi:hypothetical protein